MAAKMVLLGNDFIDGCSRWPSCCYLPSIGNIGPADTGGQCWSIRTTAHWHSPRTGTVDSSWENKLTNPICGTKSVSFQIKQGVYVGGYGDVLGGEFFGGG